MIVGIVICLSATFVQYAATHGRLIEPPSRSSMWRFGFDTEKNYNDNQLFCGGFNYQWSVNKGSCGVCGDPYDGKRENEAGGKYAKGIIVRCYNPLVKIITVTVDITTNHKGYFEFRLCPHNDTTTAVKQDCLDKYPLQLADKSGTRFFLPQPYYNGKHHVRLLMPADVTCTQCVLQWKYNSGNTWGTDPETGETDVGLGPQEQFYGCADIQILPDCNANAESSRTTKFSTKGTKEPSTTQATESSTAETKETSTTEATESSTTRVKEPSTTQTTESSTTPVKEPSTTQETESSTTRVKEPSTTQATESSTAEIKEPPTTEATESSTTGAKEFTSRETSTTTTSHTSTQSVTTTSAQQNTGDCHGHGLFAVLPGIDQWCKVNCAAGYCPPSHCACP